MEGTGSFEMLVTIHWTALYHIPQRVIFVDITMRTSSLTLLTNEILIKVRKWQVTAAAYC
jgi:hypothetical protein